MSLDTNSLVKAVKQAALDAVLASRPIPDDAVVTLECTNNAFRFRYGAKLYKTIPASHTFAAQWVPGVGTESLYARIDEEHGGTMEDPIPYGGNMELTEGLYYTQGGVVYLCTRGTGQPVYNALSDLAGIYVETVA